jgi:ADP-ribose pyrophosphatase YjhB (NUDIX family)
VALVDVRVGAYAVIVRDGDLLLTHWNENGRTGWTLPGGGLEDYETTEQAAIREVREETGYDVELRTLLGVDSLFLDPEQRFVPGTGPLHALRVVYLGRVVGGELTDEVGGSSDEARWVRLDDVGELPTLSLVTTAVDMLLRRLAGERKD